MIWAGKGEFMSISKSNERAVRMAVDASKLWALAKFGLVVCRLRGIGLLVEEVGAMNRFMRAVDAFELIVKQ